MSDIETAALRFQAEMMANDWLCDSTVGHEVGTCLGCITVALGPALTAYNEAIGEKVGRSADEVISELGSDYVTNLSREREELRAENERLRDRIDSLRDGLAEVAAGEPDVTPAGLPTALRSRAKSTLDIDDEDAALHPQAITGKGGCDVCGSMSIEPHLPSCPVLHPQEGNDD